MLKHDFVFVTIAACLALTSAPAAPRKKEAPGMTRATGIFDVT